MSLYNLKMDFLAFFLVRLLRTKDRPEAGRLSSWMAWGTGVSARGIAMNVCVWTTFVKVMAVLLLIVPWLLFTTLFPRVLTLTITTQGSLSRPLRRGKEEYCVTQRKPQ